MNLEQMIKRQSELLEAAKTAKREFTAEEQAEFDSLQRSIDALKTETKVDPVDNSKSVEDVASAERTRCAEITNLCRDFNINGEVATGYIKNGTSVDAVRKAILDDMVRNSAPVSTGVVEVTADAQDKFVRAASEALLMRSGRQATNENGGAELRGLSLRDLAIECLEAEGKNVRRMDNDSLYAELSRQFFNPTAAFPAILDATVNKVITEEYQKVPTTFQTWTRKGSLKDFKQTSDHSYLFGGVGDFELVPENGELKNSVPQTHLLPQKSLQTYGKQFSMSRHAFINDDIGFLTEVPAAYTAAAKKTIDKKVYQILMNNPAIFDGVNLFHATHGNLVGSGAAPSQDSIQEIILLSQGQKDPFSDPIYEVPEFLIVPMGYEFKLATIFKSAQVTGSSNNDINPLYNYPLQVVQTPWINALAGENAKPWFMVTDPMTSKSIEVDYLNGQETPTFRRMETAGQLGFVWDIYLDWGINVVDFRGIYKNPGTV